MGMDETQYRFIVESSPNMIWRSGTDALCNYFNRTWLEFTGRSMEQEIGNGWVEDVHPDDLDRCVRIYIENFNKQMPFEMEYRLRRYDNEWRWINDRGVPFYDSDNKFKGFIGSCIDVTERVEGEKLIQMARFDGLTGASNRRYFFERAQFEFEKTIRYKTELCIVMTDLDSFKKINDDFGHLAGDRVLIHFANTVQKYLRKFDLFGRYGGDEFILLMTHTSKEAAIKVMERIDKFFGKLFNIEGNCQIPIQFSYGIASSHEGSTLDGLVDKADNALYLMKQNKHNSINKPVVM